MMQTQHAPSPAPWQHMMLTERERAYSPSSCIGGNYQRFMAAYTSRSQEAYADCQTRGAVWSSHAYGGQAAQRLHLCMPPAPGAAQGGAVGLLLFIHGGYWQELSAQESLFPASACVARGLAFAALDYTLAPDATVAEIVAECRSAVGWLFQHAKALGVDANRIVVAGSSAGAHLAAMVALPGALPDGAGGLFAIHAAVLVSGIYALEPLVGTSINTALGLNPETARQASPILSSVAGFPKTLVCWGEVETQEFKRQSRDFANALGAVGTVCETFEVTERNHFDVIMELADPTTRIAAATFALFDAT